MVADRYLKFILTVIACELLWLGLKTVAAPVAAQQPPTPVVVTGFQIGSAVYTTLPVSVVGAWPGAQGERQPAGMVRPVRVEVSEPVRLDMRQPLAVQQPLIVQTGREPLIVQTGQRPLAVESVPARPGARPGL